MLLKAGPKLIIQTQREGMQFEAVPYHHLASVDLTNMEAKALPQRHMRFFPLCISIQLATCCFPFVYYRLNLKNKKKNLLCA